MKKYFLFISLVVLASAGCKDNKPENEGCANSGGTIAQAWCCTSAEDFPNTCAIGACGCGPGANHLISVCDCGPEKCFNGSECVDKESRSEQ